MKAKYFEADSREAAEVMAEKFFNCDKKRLEFEVVGGEDGPEPWLILARLETHSEHKDSDAGFGLYYEDDGVYFEMYKERGSGEELNTSTTFKYLIRKNISDINFSVIHNIIPARSGRVRIAPAQQEYIFGEDLSVSISRDELKATATLLEPEPGGAPMDYETAADKIREAGVVHGLNEQWLRELIERKDYNEPYTVAEATPPINGDSGVLVFHFSKDERTGRPREIGGGRVDLRSLDLYEPVTEGQLLVTRTIASEGFPGVTVTDKIIKQKPGKDINLPKGKNVDINEDKTEMHAKCSGMVEFLHNSVNVSSVYKINGDCDISVGNIDFDGSVHISGSVRSGYTVKAAGAIVVGGSVEAATLIAGGNVEVKGGMQGADKGRIEADGSITVLYIERGAAIAERSINLDVCVHSVLEAGLDITAKGKRGAIIGGRAGAAGNVKANIIGNVSYVQTEIEVGMTPKKRARIQHLDKEIDKLKGDLVKLDQLDAYLAGSKEKMDPDTWNKLFTSGVENRRIDEQLISEYNQEAEDLRLELEHATDSKVHVFDTAFHGTKIIIGNGVYKIANDIQFATFKYRDAEVIYTTCELSKA